MKGQVVKKDGVSRNIDNETYPKLIKSFKRWVDKNSQAIDFSDRPMNKYVSRTTILEFFRRDIAKRDIGRKAIGNWVQALNKLCVNEDSALQNLRQNTSIKDELNPLINQMIDNKEARMKKSDIRDLDFPKRSPFSCPSQEKITQIMMTQLSENDVGWENLAIHVTTSSTTLMRFANIQKLTLKHMTVKTGLPPHGVCTPHDNCPWEKPAYIPQTDTTLFGFHIPFSDQLKRNGARQRAKLEGLVSYRNKQFNRDSSGIIAFALIGIFDQSEMSFKEWKKVPRGYTHWSLINLLSDTKYRTMHKQMTKALDKADADFWGKKTHLRTLGCFHLSFQGIKSDEAKTQTKHKEDNYDKSYTSPCSVKPLVCLANFNPNDPNDPYWVPRSNIQVPIEINKLTNLIFTKREKWIDESNAVDGDKSPAALHFLYKVLPHLAKVIVQDGIYWVEHFPHNSAVILLVYRLNSCFPHGYTSWASEERKKQAALIKAYHDSIGTTSAESPFPIRHEGPDQHANSNRLLLNEVRRIIEEQHATERRFMTTQYHDMQLMMMNHFRVINYNNGAGSDPLSVAPSIYSPIQPFNDYGVGINNVRASGMGSSTQVVGATILEAEETTVTVWSPNSYKSLKMLISYSDAHGHNLITKGMKGYKFQNKTRDANNWSKLNRLRERVKVKMIELYGNEETALKQGKNNNGISIAMIAAAEKLDKERGEFSMSMDQYQKSLPRGASRKRKRA